MSSFNKIILLTSYRGSYSNFSSKVYYTSHTKFSFHKPELGFLLVNDNYVKHLLWKQYKKTKKK